MKNYFRGFSMKKRLGNTGLEGRDQYETYAKMGG
jgi:hypothetical protein